MMRESNTGNEPELRIRRSNDRGFDDRGWTDNWMTFSFANYHDLEWNNYGPLRVIVENHIQPHSGFPAHSHREVEIVTYVASGVLTHSDSFGHQAGIGAGEMQLISAGSRGMVHAEENKGEEVEHNLQMWLIPDHAPTEFAYHQKLFTPEQRQGRFCLYVSPDGRDDSMPINTDAFIYAGLFQPGDEVTYSLASGRGAWVQMVCGKLSMAGETFTSGDGVGISNIDATHFDFDADSEVLLFDVRLDAPLLWR